MNQIAERKTKQAFLWSSALDAPFYAMYELLLFILAKGLGASLLQITLLIALKPAASLFSIYWSALVHKRPDRLRSNVIIAALIGHLPFLLFPFISNGWFIVGAGALFLMMKRGMMPAWMEIIKLNVPDQKRERTFSQGSSISYLGMALLAIFFAKWMDMSPDIWRILFPITALLSLCRIFFQWRIPITKLPEEKNSISVKEALIKPWRETWNLLKTRPDFLRYQIGFMLGGGGLMIMQPALPFYFDHVLKMSYTEFALAIAIFKGIGFALTSRIWASLFSRMHIYRFSSFVTLLAALFPLGILLGQWQLLWVYVAYFAYGIMQAGSELSWHLSGPTFSKNEDSSAYSAVNVVMVGVRGLFAPILGSLLCGYSSAALVLLLGGGLCALASLQLTLANRRQSAPSTL